MRSALPIILAGLISTVMATNLAAQANLLVGPTSLEFAVPDGGSQPLPQEFLVASSTASSNAAASSVAGLPFEAHSTAPWLFVSQTWGATPAAPRVSVDATGLENGVYHGYISITSGMSTPAMLAVTLRVGGVVNRSSAAVTSIRAAEQTIRSFPRGLTFIAKSGTGAPAPQSLFVPKSARENGVEATSSAAWLAVLRPGSVRWFPTTQGLSEPRGLGARSIYRLRAVENAGRRGADHPDYVRRRRRCPSRSGAERAFVPGATRVRTHRTDD